MNKALALRKNMQQYSPRLLAEAFYSLALKGFQLGVQVYGGRTHIQLWARNSYYQGNWVPFQSDIDLSIWLAKDPSNNDVERLLRTHRLVKTLFPVLGEMNLYVATESGWIEQFINVFELQRDPILAKKVSYRGPIGRNFHAATFLLRMLESDIERVLGAPEGRHPKWDAHFQRVTEVVGGAERDIWKGFPERSLLRGVLDLVSFALQIPEEHREPFAEQLEFYFQSIGRKVPVYLLAPALKDKPYLWAAFPHRFCFLAENRPVLDAWLAELCQAQFSWELFGMLTQFRMWRQNESEKAAMRTHLQSLRAFYKESVQKKSTHPDMDENAFSALDRLLKLC